MRIVILSVVFLSFAALSQAGVLSDVDRSVTIIDTIIKTILDKMRPKLADIKIPDVNETVKNQDINATVKLNGMLIQNADKFQVETIKSSLVPPKLSNLTLTWKNITATADYDVNATVGIPKLPAINVFAKGKAKAVLSKIFFTVGANVELKDKTIQIKKLFDFDLKIGNADVSFSSLMGNPQFGKSVGKFISDMIPNAVETFKNPLFDIFHDDIVAILNSMLKKEKTILSDDETISSDNSVDNFDLNEVFAEAFSLISEDFESDFSNF